MEHFEWGLLVVNYLFLAGLSAGAFAVSSFATYIGGPHFRRVARIGALIAPWPVVIGIALLVFDLGRPLAFYHLFLIVQFTSPMSIGSWLLTGFVLLAFVYAALWLPAPLDNLLRIPQAGQFRHYSRWTILPPETIRRWRAILAAIGFPFALGVGIYTGILLGAVPSRPFWNTPMVAQLFLFSAMSSGVATVLLVTALLGTRHEHGYEEERRLLISTDAVMIGLEILMIIPFLLHHALSTRSSASSIGLILGREYTLWFWVGVILLGILVPLAIETYELLPVILKQGTARRGISLTVVSAVLVISGGFILRFVFVYAGQASHFLPLIPR